MDTVARSPVAGEAGRRIAYSIAVGLVSGLLAIIQSIGYGTLLFSALPVPLLSNGAGMALFSSAILAALVPFLSSTRGVVAVAQSVPVAALAGIAGAIAANVAPGNDRVVLATVVVAVALTSLAIGAGSWLLGFFRLSRFVRFFPFPVVGGFLAGSGWLVLVGGIDAIAGAHFIDAPFQLLAQPTMLGRMASAVGLILAVVLVQRLSRGWRLALPVTLAVALVLFNLVVWLMGIPHAALRADRWLMALPSGHALWPPLLPADLTLVDWRAIAGQTLALATIPVLAVIATLMNATGIELDARRDLDLDRELRAVGIGNLLAGAGAGVPGYHSLSGTALAARLGASDATVGLTVAICCAAAAAFGPQILSLVPTPLFGGVLLWIGGGLLNEWLIRAHRRLARAEYAVVVLIFAIIAFVGFAWGILVGLIAAAVLFAVDYGRVDIVRYTLTGRDYQTGADSSNERLEVLRESGEAILLIRLQGYLFFGTAERLRKRILERLADTAASESRFLVIDFERVSGLDSSAVLSFIRLSQAAAPAGFLLVLTGMSDAVKGSMMRGGLVHGEASPVRIEPSFDHGVEWCENALLSHVAPTLATAQSRPALDILAGVVGDAAFAEALIPYCERVEIAAGEALITQGRPSDDIFFIEAGRAAVELVNGSQTVRLTTLAHGAIVGEIAFYLSVPRSASVVAESAVVAWRFSRANLERLSASEPEIAVRFHQGIAAMLAERLTRTNRLVQLLAD